MKTDKPSVPTVVAELDAYKKWFMGDHYFSQPAPSRLILILETAIEYLIECDFARENEYYLEKMVKALEENSKSQTETERVSLKKLKQYENKYGPLDDEQNLPTFKDMYDMAPNATGGIPAEDFIANLRERKDNETND